MKSDFVQSQSIMFLCCEQMIFIFFVNQRQWFLLNLLWNHCNVSEFISDKLTSELAPPAGVDGGWTHDLWFTRPTPSHLATTPVPRVSSQMGVSKTRPQGDVQEEPDQTPEPPQLTPLDAEEQRL